VYFGGQASTDGASLQVDGDVYALNANGSEAWTFPTGGVIDHAPAIGADGTIYVVAGSDDPDNDPDVGTLYAINPDGTEAWSAALDGCPGGGPTVGADGAVYVPISGCRFGGSGVLEAFDSGGTPLWTFEVTGEFKVLLGSVPIAADGTAYVASQLTGEVYAVKTASLGLAASAWPKAGHDNQNSGGAAGGN
jgi:outer membrane protein assembly factor BamB